MRITNRQILLLNCNYVPIGAIEWRKAFDLVVVRRKAEVVHMYPEHAPAVIALTIRIPDHHRRRTGKMKYRKSAIFRRDNNTCVYCGFRAHKKSDLTIDHVMPRSRGGQSSYANCVTCCMSCNNAKGCRTPEEARMPMMHPPRVVPISNSIYLNNPPQEWENYIGNL